jgi:hypothetical protein
MTAMSATARRLVTIVYVVGAWTLLRRRRTTQAIRALIRRGPRVEGSDARGMAYTVRRISEKLHIDCLPQSVALAAMLERAGANPVLILGCRRSDDAAWVAHAWVEVAGEPLDAGASAFMRLAQLSADGAWVPAARNARAARSSSTSTA